MADAPFVYLDWAATAPLSLEAVRAMAPYLEAGMAGLVQGNGNANALHTAGRDAFKTLEAARRDIAAHDRCATQRDHLHLRSDRGGQRCPHRHRRGGSG